MEDISLWSDSAHSLVDTIDFKKHVLTRLSVIDDKLCEKASKQSNTVQPTLISSEERLISRLDNTIKSLEKQLNDKQIIIESLLTKRPSQISSNGVSLSTNNERDSSDIQNKWISTDNENNSSTINKVNNNHIKDNVSV